MYRSVALGTTTTISMFQMNNQVGVHRYDRSWTYDAANVKPRTGDIVRRACRARWCASRRPKIGAVVSTRSMGG